MGAKCVEFLALYLCSLCICINSYPVEKGADPSELNSIADETRWPQLLAVAFTVTCVLVLLGCLSCCKQRAGFKEFRNSVSESNVNSVGLDFVNPLQNVQPSRYSIFSSIVEATIEKQPDSIVTFEPLPKVLPTKFTSSLRLPQFNGNANDIGFIEEWLGEKDFPRQQLHYLRECGQGWFGKVVEGEARGILPSSNKVYRVIVRILKEDATAVEQTYFLQEARPYKELSHPNVLKLLGRCLENAPFLLVFETCANGDLKSYLRQNVGNRDALIFQGIILRMAVDVASGLSYMLQHSFVHTDIAARNCLVTGDLRVKVGDYGTSLQQYKDEYYINGDIALPIRWCAPETLNCSDTCIEPKPVSGTSCIWSYGVLLWELEEWGELPYRELTNDQVITKVFGEGYRLPFPSNRTPYSQEIYNIMQECWKEYSDRPSFIHVMNALSALMHRYKNSDHFESRWHTSKPNTIPVVDNADKLNSQLASLASKADNDSGIDLDNPSRLRGLSMSQLQQSVSRQRIMNDELSSESPASSRRFSNSSTGDLFSSPVSRKHRSPSLENLHGSLDTIGILGRRISGDEVFGSSSSDFWPKERRTGEEESGSAKVNFQLGLCSRTSDASILWSDKPLFQTDSFLEDTSFMKRTDSLSTDAEEELWRKRIERGEFTEKVKEKSKSVADLMVLTHIECSESSESDSLPSFHSRQSSFNRHSKRAPKLSAAAPLSLFNSLSFGSESNLPAVEKDDEFQEALKKIQIAKINGDEDSLNLVSLQANSLVSREEGGGGGSSSAGAKIGPHHFLANEASETRSPHYHSSHIYNACSIAIATSQAKLPLFDNSLFDGAATPLEKRAPGDGAESAACEEPSTVASNTTKAAEPKVLVTDESSRMVASAPPAEAATSTEEIADSVVIGPSECDTLEYFKGLKTTLVDQKLESPAEESAEPSFQPSSPPTLTDFLQDSSDDYFYKCSNEEIEDKQQLLDEVAQTRSTYCEYCYAKCHFSNECLRCKDKSLEENCSCESFENLEKYRDCTALNSCPFQSDDSGRGTDQINSGDGSSDKSLEGSISVQMNEVKNRLEDVIAKFAVTDELSDDNCSSLEDDKDSSPDCVEEFIEKVKAVGGTIEVLELETQDHIEDCSNDEFKVQVFEVDDEDVGQPIRPAADVENMIAENDVVVGGSSRRDSLLAISEENDNSASFEEDTCIGTGMASSNSGKWSEDGESESESELKDEGAEEEDEKSSSSRTFVKVEQLFFNVDPKFEREYEAELSKSESFSKFDNSLSECSDMNFSGVFVNDSTTLDSCDVKLQATEPEVTAAGESSMVDAAGVASLDADSAPEVENRVEYEISDILEGLCEPISLPYSVNRPADECKEVPTEGAEAAVTADESTVSALTPPPSLENTTILNSWLPSPVDDQEEDNDEDDESFGQKRVLCEMDLSFIEAIRNELREKLPNTSTLAIVEPEESCEPAENTNITIEYNSYPSQLSPILEEEEEDCSVASSVSSSFCADSDDSSSETLNGGYDGGDDLLVVNVDTNEASIVDTVSAANTLSSPLFQQPVHNLNETYDIIDENDDTIGFTDPLDSDSFPSPDSLSPGTSSKTGAQLSYSSSDCGNLSDVFLSPSSSSKNFDDFDTDRSTEDGRHLNTPENVLQSDSRDEYQKAIFNIDEMLKKSECGSQSLTPTSSGSCNMVSECSAVTPNEPSATWLKSFFMPVEETSSMVEFEAYPSLAESEFRSLPADFKSENWPAAEELVGHNQSQVKSEKVTDEVSATSPAAEVTPDNSSKANDSSVPATPSSTPVSGSTSDLQADNSKVVTSTPAKESQPVPIQSVKQKNSLALFGNSCKQIRNFQVSVVEEDCFGRARTSPTSPKNMDVCFGEQLLGTSPKHSEKTWKSSSPLLNSFLGSQNLETLGLKELSVGDMMSTSFIESGSQDGSVDGKDENQQHSDDSDDDDEGMESTCDEFVWKKNDDTFVMNQSDVKETDFRGEKAVEDDDEDDDDDDDEELTDFVPFSWNSDAVPQRSALKNKERLRSDKKNVSFKKQKYHCVYEYPKEEPNYSRRYDAMLQERMLNFLNLNQDYLYNDYSSFSDWELDDCEEQPPCSDDLLPFPMSPALSSKTNLSNKLGFYTIGAYDLDSSTKADDVSPSFVNSNSVSSPTTYSSASSTLTSGPQVSSDGGEKNGNISQATDHPAAGKFREFNFENVKLPNGDKSPSPSDGYGELLSPGLGELRHAKSRLTLDLNLPSNPKAAEPAEKLSSPEKRREPETPTHRQQPDDGELLEESCSDDFVDDFGGLNYKACDISPVVELKSLTSTSVA